jgi:phosphoribosylglycinamide formyltransferase-1
VLVSGSGTNLQALLDAPGVRSRVALVVSDRAEAGALAIARAAGIPVAVVPFEDHPDRESFSLAVADAVEASGAKGVVLAGFMRVLSPVFIDRFPGRVLNIHPSLLPSFPGSRAVESALAHGVKVTGVTVHFVDEQVDHGPIIAQEAVRVEEDDSAETLHLRIKEVEHRLYPPIVQAFVDGDVVLGGTIVVRR